MSDKGSTEQRGYQPLPTTIQEGYQPKQSLPSNPPKVRPPKAKK